MRYYGWDFGVRIHDILTKTEEILNRACYFYSSTSIMLNQNDSFKKKQSFSCFTKQDKKRLFSNLLKFLRLFFSTFKK
jgi:hypothetical protein